MFSGSLRCNGEFNCEDRSDETDCNTTCSDGEFQCANPKFCILQEWRCDGDVGMVERFHLSKQPNYNVYCILKIAPTDRTKFIATLLVHLMTLPVIMASVLLFFGGATATTTAATDR